MAILSVGQQQVYTCLQRAVADAQPHDEIQIFGALDVARPIVTSVPLRVIGIGTRPIVTMRGFSPHGAGLLTTSAATHVSNIEFRQARALTGNGAGIWHLGGDLSVEDCVFARNQNGIMIVGEAEDTARISGCSFVANGAGCGHTHGIYANGRGRLEISHCSFEDTWVGHHVKSRAAGTSVTACYFGGSPRATTSYAIDVANGGVAEITRSQFVKGRGSMSRKFIAFSPEPRRHSEDRLLVAGNIFISHRRDPSIAVVNFAPGVPAVLRQNAYEGWILALLGRGRDTKRQRSSEAIMRGAPAATAGL